MLVQLLNKLFYYLNHIFLDHGLLNLKHFFPLFYSSSSKHELQYNFMARKSDGSTCLVEGVMLGGGIHSSDGAPTYTGDCTAETLPLA